MEVKIAAPWIYLNTTNAEDIKKLELHHNAVKTTKGYRLPLNLWCLREIYKDWKEPDILTAGKVAAIQHQSAIQMRKNIKVLSNPSKLRDYQIEDAIFLASQEAAGVFNEPRTGKTPTLIHTMKRINKTHNLVVCPASLVYYWQNEIFKWWPEAITFVAAGSKREAVYDEFFKAKFSSVLIVSKNTWRKDYLEYSSKKFDVCVIDEAHFLRNRNSVQTRAIYKIEADRRYAATGTPVVNHPSDIHGILQFLYPDRYPSFWQFVDRYFGTWDTPWGGKDIRKAKGFREEELTQVIAMLSTQRKRKDIMAWIPDRTYVDIPVVMEPKQDKAYTQMALTFVADHEGAEVDAENMLSQMMRLRQICQDPRLVDLKIVGAKTKAFLDWIEDKQEPVIVMTFFTSYLKLLEPDLKKMKKRVAFLHGEMTPTQKQQAANDFQAGKIDVLLCNYITAGTGFTLDRAETLVFLDKPFTPAELEQCTDRFTQTQEGKPKKHEVVTFYCKKSIDSRIDQILKQKKSVNEIIQEGGAKALKQLLGG